jgi:hypothetical protein
MTFVILQWPRPRLPFLHNFATLKNRLIYQCPSSWPVVITMKKKLAGTWKKNRILASPNSWQQVQVCNRSNPEESDRSCEGVDFSCLSSKVSWTLLPSLVCYVGPALPCPPQIGAVDGPRAHPWPSFTMRLGPWSALVTRLRVTSHTSQEPCQWNCESPKESV